MTGNAFYPFCGQKLDNMELFKSNPKENTLFGIFDSSIRRFIQEMEREFSSKPGKILVESI